MQREWFCVQLLSCLAPARLRRCRLGTPLPVPASEEAEAAAPPKPASEESEEQKFFSAGLIQLRDPLDEPEFYCVDVPGVGATLNLQGALTAHTCKPGAEDEIFHMDSSSTGQISMPAYNLCMEADGPEAGNSLHLAECSSARLQQFRYFDIGQIRLAHGSVGELCLTVASGVGEPTGRPQPSAAGADHGGLRSGRHGAVTLDSRLPCGCHS